MQFNQIKQKLDALLFQAEQLDKKRGESRKPLFDIRLFSCLSHLLSPCVKEAKKTWETVEKEQKQGRLTEAHASHLCEKLINQVSAIQRELATVAIRSKEKRFSFKPSLSKEQLHQKLIQHQEWEKQLKNMVLIAEKNFIQCQKITDRHVLQQHLLATEQRLIRCQKAKSQIEKQIQTLEKKG